MYEILYLPLAQKDLNGIISYILDNLYSPYAAMKLLDEIEKSIVSLKQFPYSHPLYHAIKPLKEEYRFFPVNNYAVFYIVREPEKKVEIYRVLYAKRDIMNLIT